MPLSIDTPKKRVVLVDDDQVILAIMRGAINSMNCEVVAEGTTGEAAVQLYREQKPDLLLLDVTMEGMSGTEALVRIKQEFPDAFVIMLTASGDLETVQQCIQAGAAHYILKDASVARIRVMIGGALGLGRR
jgi:two-component system, chemotaxis family, chemotaxis protein CheY